MQLQSDQRFVTLPGMLTHIAATWAGSAALSWREAGYWRRMATEELLWQVRRFALGLGAIGLRPGECVGILAQPSPTWLITDLGAMAAGGISVPLFPNMAPEHFAFAIQNTDVRVLLVTGAEAWETARPHAKRFHHVITRGVTGDRGTCIDFQAVLEMGDAVAEREPGRYAAVRDAVGADDVATVIHTSGSTGNPKGVSLTHGNLVSQVHGAAQRFPLDAASDRALSCLPLAHVFERMVMYYYLSAGVGVWLADDVKNVGRLLREVKPTVMTMVPRLVEKLYAKVAADVDGAGLLRRNLGQWALDQAVHRAPDAPKAWRDDVADSLVYKKIRGALGGNLRYLIVGGAALADDLGRFLTNVGVPVYVGYGLTESAPVVSANCPGACRIGTVGKPWPGVEVRIGDEDEILARGPNIMRGYHNDPEATTATVDADGWLHTGDRGRFDDDGFLIITGRIKELFKTSNGKYVCPVPIEQALCAHRLVDQALVIAEGRTYVAALLFTDPVVMQQAKLAAGCAGESDAVFLARPEIIADIEALVASMNEHLDHWQQVRRWCFAPSAPSIERGEMTPTYKLRRHVVMENHRDLIDGLYLESTAAVAQPP